MPVPEFPQRLHEQSLPIDQIFLDPNNPRLATVSSEETPENRIAEETVQLATLRRLNDGRFDQEGLRSSIKRSGLLPIDRIVVRPIEGEQDEKYVVVEGNRRIGAIKSLLRLYADGDLTLEEPVLATIDEPHVLVLEGEGAEEARLDQWLIQGVRHISGIRPWGGYQAARTIQTMIDRLGYNEREVAEALNLSVQRVKRSMRVLAALGQMSEDDEYGEFAVPDLYSYFDEMIRRVTVRNWVRWDNDSYRFTDEDRAREFFSWIAPDEELSDEPRIPTSEGVRQLDDVLASEAALAVLNTPGNSLGDALVVAAPAPLEPEWRRPVERAIDALNAIPMGVLESLEGDDRDLIERIRDLAARRLEQADALGGTAGGGPGGGLEPDVVAVEVVAEEGEATGAETRNAG